MRLVEMGSLWGRMGVIIVDRLYDVGCMESVCGPYGFIEGVIYMRFEKCMVCVASHIVNEACTKSVQKSNPQERHHVYYYTYRYFKTLKSQNCLLEVNFVLKNTFSCTASVRRVRSEVFLSFDHMEAEAISMKYRTHPHMAAKWSSKT